MIAAFKGKILQMTMLTTLTENIPWLRLAAAILYSAAGFLVFMHLLNRWLNTYKDSSAKHVIVPMMLALWLLAPASLGYTLGDRPDSWQSLILPGVVFAGALVGQINLARTRRRLRGSPPVSRQGRRPSLARPFTTTDLQTLHYRQDLPGWQGPAFRVAHLSDQHVNHRLPTSYYQEANQKILASNPDLIFITGDFISQLDGLPRLGEALEGLRAPLGVFAVLGNHDYWAGEEQVLEVLHASGIVPLFNGSCTLHIQGHPLTLSGCEDPWAPQPWRAPQTPVGQPLLVLAHSADNFYTLSAAGADAVFSGHYHAGQFRLPGIGSLVVPSRYGRRFDQGHFVLDGTHLYVSAGVGAAAPALRLYCQPDIQIVDFFPAGTESSTPGKI